MDLRQFHEDHTFLREHARQLGRLISESGSDPECITQLLDALRVMRARLALHLAIEDRFLYPQVEAAEPEEQLGGTRALRDALGHLDQSLSELVERFDNAIAIGRQPDQFRRQLDSLLKALQLRMDQEEAQLFPIAAAL